MLPLGKPLHNLTCHLLAIIRILDITTAHIQLMTIILDITTAHIQLMTIILDITTAHVLLMAILNILLIFIHLVDLVHTSIMALLDTGEKYRIWKSREQCAISHLGKSRFFPKSVKV